MLDASSVTGSTAPSAPLDVTLIIPPSIDIRTLSRYSGLSSDDPLCEPSPRFYRLENMLSLDDDASDEFRRLNVWLEETVRYLILLLPPPPLFFYVFPSFLLFPLSFSLLLSPRGLAAHQYGRSVTVNIKSSRGTPAPSRHFDNISLHLRPGILERDQCPLCIISACTLHARA